MQASFDALAAFVKQSCGIIIEPDKLYLVESRLRPILKREKLSGLADLVPLLDSRAGKNLGKEVIDAMTINETYFFRDKTPFDKFRDVLIPKLIQARAKEKRIRIWSAASSTGQEAYSLAMALEEMGPKLAGWTIEIVGTDLAEPQLAKAREGKYTQFEVQRGLPTPYLLRYFQQRGDCWHLKDNLRNRVQFRQFNLMSDYAPLGRFDIIFCRNVLIYFEPARKSDILKRMSRTLPPDGCIVLGASESVLGLDTDLMPEPEHRCFLIKTSAASAGAAKPFAAAAAKSLKTAPPVNGSAQVARSTPSASTVSPSVARMTTLPHVATPAKHKTN